MTEDQNENVTGGPVGDPDPETAPTAAPETTSQAAIPMPAATPPPPEQPLPLPQQPDTPPMGVAHDPAPPTSSTPPQGTYAMGALAGNPMLGAPPAAILVRRSPAHRPRGPHVASAPGAWYGDRQQHSPRAQRPPGRSRRAGGPGCRLRHRARNDEQRRQHAGLQPDLGQLAPAIGIRVRRLEVLGGLRLIG